MITVITVCFNSESTIRKCLESVLSQNYENYEHLIIDGKSTDKTLEIIKNFPSKKIRVISEEDEGICDAFNKGLISSKGDIVGYLNSDDYFSSAHALEKIINEISNGADVVYSNIEYVTEGSHRPIRRWEAKDFNKKSLNFGWMPPHTSFYFKKGTKTRLIRFDESFKVSFDYDFMLRILTIEGLKISYIDDYLVKMIAGGNSNKSLKNIYIKMKEDFYILKSHAFNPFLGLLFKNLRKIRQFFF